MRFQSWLEENWVWLALSLSFVAVVLIIAFSISDETVKAIGDILETPLSEVKFWHLLIGMYLVVIIGSPRNSSK